MGLAYYFQAGTKSPALGRAYVEVCMNYAREKKLAAFKRNIGRKSKFEMQYEAIQAACTPGLAAKASQGIAASAQKH